MSSHGQGLKLSEDVMELHYAAKVNLDYDLNNAFQDEATIIYYSRDWEDLPSLIEAPREFIRGQQFLWKQKAKDAIAWDLKSPVTTNLRCGFNNPAGLLSGASVITQLVSAVEPQPFHSPGMEGMSFEDLFFDPGNLSNLIRALSKTFIVEFNIYTSSLDVTYYPPSGEQLEEMKKSMNARWGRPNRYASEFPNPIIIDADAGVVTRSVLHFDLGDKEKTYYSTSERLRADFVTCALEDPTWFADQLKDRSEKGKVSRLKYRLTPQGSEQMGVIQGAGTIPRDLVFATGTPDIYDLDVPPKDENEAMREAYKILKRYKMYLSMQVNDGSAGGPAGFKCGNCAVYSSPKFKNVDNHGKKHPLVQYIDSCTVQEYPSLLFKAVDSLRRSGVDTSFFKPL